MFINCPHCGALVATDPATDQPPPRCPRCAATLRDDPATAANAASPDPGPASSAPVDHGHARVSDATALAAEAGAPPVDAAAPGTTMTGTTVGAPPVEPAPPSPAADGSAATGGPAVAAVPARQAPAALRPGVTAPSFARGRTGPVAAAPTARRWLLPTLIAGLSLLLAMQWLLADRDRLAADPRWRPLLLQGCAALRCSVPPWREPAALSLLDRDVRPHPRQPGVLRVNATFRNDARWAQAWPRILLTLSDVDGRVVAARRFEPAEYLGAPPAQAALAPGQSAAIRMDVVEPAPGIVAFAFAFE
jgi:hypothetical protein